MVNDTAMSQFIPPTLVHFSTGTITTVAGTVAGTIARNRAAADQTTLITVPVLIPSNSVALKGSWPTTITAKINKITRGVDGAVAVVAAQAFTQSPTAANSKTVDQHKLVLTITAPFWILNTEYVLVELAVAAGAGGNTMHVLGAVANFNERL
jgi:hypothetical protein